MPLRTSSIEIGPTDAERFEKYYERITETGCWIWTSSRVGHTRYGAFRVRPAGKYIWKRAHRVAWTIYKGPIPDGALLCHRCDVPECVNPNHMFLGTNTENLSDMTQKGRRFCKLSDDQVRSVRSIKGPLSKTRAHELAADLGVHWLYLYQLRKGERPSLSSI